MARSEGTSLAPAASRSRPHRLAAAVVVGALIGCKEDPLPSRAPSATVVDCKDRQCVGDYANPCRSDGGACARDEHCVPGAVCRPLTCGDAGCTSTCRAFSHPVSRYALRDGFGVPELELNIHSSGAYKVVEWTPPDGTSVVTCALFTCAPRFARSEANIASIANLERCAIGFENFAGDGVQRFDLGDAHLAEPPHAAVACVSPSLDPPPRRFELLAVGCWSYGDLSITRASQLVPLAPSDTVFTRRAAVTSCEQEAGSTDSTQCYDPDSETFGQCSGGRCLRRCLVEDDCLDEVVVVGADAGDAGATVDASHEPRCIPGSRPNDPMGVCRDQVLP